MVQPDFKYPINKELILPRLDDVRRSIEKLKRLRAIEKKDFLAEKTDHWALTAYHLQRCLEGLLSCGSHILLRMPGTKFDEYKTIAAQLVDYDILPAKFKQTSIDMAGYRNRLIHFYHEVSKEELYDILQKHIPDLEKFYTYLLRFTQNQ